MANQRPSPDNYSEAIDELRRLARAPFETPKELLRLRHRMTNERARTHRRILERIAKQAHVDLEPILEDARRRNAAKRHHVTKTLAKLEAQAAELAKTEKKHFHRIRSDYLNSFGGKPPLAAGGAELKFHQPIAWQGEARPGDCNVIVGSWFDVDLGTYEASAEIAAPGDVGIWLYPYIYSDTSTAKTRSAHAAGFDLPDGSTNHELHGKQHTCRPDRKWPGEQLGQRGPMVVSVQGSQSDI
jgi:hypothetical protein